MMKKILLFPLVFISVLSFSQTNEINIVPQPVQVKKGLGEFLLNNKNCILTYTDELAKFAEMLNFY